MNALLISVLLVVSPPNILAALESIKIEMLDSSDQLIAANTVSEGDRFRFAITLEGDNFAENTYLEYTLSGPGRRGLDGTSVIDITDDNANVPFPGCAPLDFAAPTTRLLTCFITAVKDIEAEMEEQLTIQASLIFPISSVKSNLTFTIRADVDARGLFGGQDPSVPLLVQEGNSYNVTIVRERGAFESVDVTWRLRPTFTDRDRNDFSSDEGIVTFLENERNKTFHISVTPNDGPELDEIFLIDLSTPGAVENPIQKQIKIIRNEEPNGRIKLQVGNCSCNF